MCMCGRPRGTDSRNVFYELVMVVPGKEMARLPGVWSGGTLRLAPLSGCFVLHDQKGPGSLFAGLTCWGSSVRRYLRATR